LLITLRAFAGNVGTGSQGVNSRTCVLIDGASGADVTAVRILAGPVPAIGVDADRVTTCKTTDFTEPAGYSMGSSVAAIRVLRSRG
jgi:hypothetical protein